MPILDINYLPSSREAQLSLSGENAESIFIRLLRLLNDSATPFQRYYQNTIWMPWGSLLAAKAVIFDFRTSYGVQIRTSEAAASLLARATQRTKAFRSAVSNPPIPHEELKDKLGKVGFIRALSEHQERNICKMAALPAAATFSVPGAGKTTEALAYFAFRAKDDDRLLVIAPKNALGAWDEQLSLCFNTSASFLRLTGGESNIDILLRNSSRFMIITYQQLARDRVATYVSNYLAENQVFVFIDESHRIKGKGITSTTIGNIAFLPIGKLIMSGTPMPQDIDDLLPQFGFLYPEIASSSSTVVAQLSPIFVRTTKKEMHLPEVHRLAIMIPMTSAQERLYNLLKSETARQAEATLHAIDRNAFRSLGRSVMKLLQTISNPALLLPSWDIESELLEEAIDSGDSPKVSYACQRARQLAQEDRKVLIWSSFRENVEIIAKRLNDIGSVFIHGGVGAGDEDDETTRESRIHRFLTDPYCHVMVANPAAAAEGISLHTKCHYAIYVDRTYNAAHYLQSEDRIHRFGTTISPVIEILQCPNTIDLSVASRLEAKTNKMAIVLNDPSLKIVPREISFSTAEDESDESMMELNFDDVRSILENLGASS